MKLRPTGHKGEDPLSWHDLHLVAGLVEPCGPCCCLLLLAVTVREIPKVLLHFWLRPGCVCEGDWSWSRKEDVSEYAHVREQGLMASRGKGEGEVKGFDAVDLDAATYYLYRERQGDCFDERIPCVWKLLLFLLLLLLLLLFSKLPCTRMYDSYRWAFGWAACPRKAQDATVGRRPGSALRGRPPNEAQAVHLTGPQHGHNGCLRYPSQAHSSSCTE